MADGITSPWWTAAQAAQYARVGKKLLYAEVAAGRLQAVRVGGRRALRFRAEFLDCWLESQMTTVNAFPTRRGAA